MFLYFLISTFKFKVHQCICTCTYLRSFNSNCNFKKQIAQQDEDTSTLEWQFHKKKILCQTWDLNQWLWLATSCQAIAFLTRIFNYIIDHVVPIGCQLSPVRTQQRSLESQLKSPSTIPRVCTSNREVEQLLHLRPLLTAMRIFAQTWIRRCG